MNKAQYIPQSSLIAQPSHPSVSSHELVLGFINQPKSHAGMGTGKEAAPAPSSHMEVYASDARSMIKQPSSQMSKIIVPPSTKQNNYSDYSNGILQNSNKQINNHINQRSQIGQSNQNEFMSHDSHKMHGVTNNESFNLDVNLQSNMAGEPQIQSHTHVSQAPSKIYSNKEIHHTQSDPTSRMVQDSYANVKSLYSNNAHISIANDVYRPSNIIRTPEKSAAKYSKNFDGHLSSTQVNQHPKPTFDLQDEYNSIDIDNFLEAKMMQGNDHSFVYNAQDRLERAGIRKIEPILYGTNGHQLKNGTKVNGSHISTGNKSASNRLNVPHAANTANLSNSATVSNKQQKPLHNISTTNNLMMNTTHYNDHSYTTQQFENSSSTSRSDSTTSNPYSLRLDTMISDFEGNSAPIKKKRKKRSQTPSSQYYPPLQGPSARQVTYKPYTTFKKWIPKYPYHRTVKKAFSNIKPSSPSKTRTKKKSSSRKQAYAINTSMNEIYSRDSSMISATSKGRSQTPNPTQSNYIHPQQYISRDLPPRSQTELGMTSARSGRSSSRKKTRNIINGGSSRLGIRPPSRSASAMSKGSPSKPLSLFFKGSKQVRVDSNLSKTYLKGSGYMQKSDPNDSDMIVHPSDTYNKKSRQIHGDSVDSEGQWENNRYTSQNNSKKSYIQPTFNQAKENTSIFSDDPYKQKVTSHTHYDPYEQYEQYSAYIDSKQMNHMSQMNQSHQNHQSQNHTQHGNVYHSNNQSCHNKVDLPLPKSQVPPQNASHKHPIEQKPAMTAKPRRSSVVLEQTMEATFESLSQFKFGDQDDSYSNYNSVDLHIDLVMYQYFVSSTTERYRQFDLVEKVIDQIPNVRRTAKGIDLEGIKRKMRHLAASC